MGFLIARGAGSVGSALANYLAQPGHRVRYRMPSAQALGHPSTLKLPWSNYLLEMG